MPLHDNWHYRLSSPQNVHCAACGLLARPLVPTDDYTYHETGIVQQLYVCMECLRGYILRYVPSDVKRWLIVNTLAPADVSIDRYMVSVGVAPSRLRAVRKARRS